MLEKNLSGIFFLFWGVKEQVKAEVEEPYLPFNR